MSRTREVIDIVSKYKAQGLNYKEIQQKLIQDGVTKEDGTGYTLQTISSYGSNARKYYGTSSTSKKKRSYTKRAKTESRVQTLIVPETRTNDPVAIVITNRAQATQMIKEFWG